MMAKPSKARQRLSFVLRNTGETFTVSEVARVLDLQPVEASKILSRWASQGWVVRLRQGLYAAIPLKSSGGEMVLENPWVIVPVLFEHAYVGGWSAAQHWDLTEQIFSSVCVLTSDKIRRKDQVIGGTRFFLSSMRGDRHFGLRFEWQGKQRIAISDPVKTVVDMFHKPSLGGGIQHVAECLRNFRGSNWWDQDQLIEYANSFQSGALNKRLGVIAEILGLHELASNRLSHISSGNVQLDPKNPGTKLITRWRVWVPEHWSRWVQE